MKNSRLFFRKQVDRTSIMIHWSGKEQQLFELSNQALSDDEIKDIVAFLGALDGEI